MSAVSTADATALFADLTGGGAKKSEVTTPQEGVFQSILAQVRAPAVPQTPPQNAAGSAAKSTPESSAENAASSEQSEGEGVSDGAKQLTIPTATKPVPRSAGAKSPDAAMIKTKMPETGFRNAAMTTEGTLAQAESRGGIEMKKGVDPKIEASANTATASASDAPHVTRTRPQISDAQHSTALYNEEAELNVKATGQGSLPVDGSEPATESSLVSAAKSDAHRHSSMQLPPLQGKTPTHAEPKTGSDSVNTALPHQATHEMLKGAPVTTHTALKAAEPEPSEAEIAVKPEVAKKQTVHTSAVKIPASMPAGADTLATTQVPATEAADGSDGNDSGVVMSGRPKRTAQQMGPSAPLPSQERTQHYAANTVTAKQTPATVASSSPAMTTSQGPELSGSEPVPTASAAAESPRSAGTPAASEAVSAPASSSTWQMSSMQKGTVADNDAKPKSHHKSEGHHTKVSASAPHAARAVAHHEIHSASIKIDGDAAAVNGEGKAPALNAAVAVPVNASPAQHAQTQLQTLLPAQNGTMVMPGELSGGGEQAPGEGGSQETMHRPAQEMPPRNARNFSMAIRVDDVVINARLRPESLRLMIDMDGMHGVHEKSLGGQIQTILNESGFKSYRLTIKERSRKVYDHAEQLHVAVEDTKGHAGFSVRA